MGLKNFCVEISGFKKKIGSKNILGANKIGQEKNSWDTVKIIVSRHDLGLEFDKTESP